MINHKCCSFYLYTIHKPFAKPLTENRIWKESANVINQILSSLFFAKPFAENLIWGKSANVINQILSSLFFAKPFAENQYCKENNTIQESLVWK